MTYPDPKTYAPVNLILVPLLKSSLYPEQLSNPPKTYAPVHLYNSKGRSLCIYLSIYLPVKLQREESVYLSIYLSIYLPV